ncbi:MAG: GatB/YqeY domain-containing protein [Azoarcus sp.]|jgi:uncharacterized protein YqeY|nr:GatB/YqeY domain-containing protein [Azoarcus sp.]
MSLLAQLKKDALLARKARDTPRAALLTTLIAEAGMIGKNDGNRDSSDDEILQTLRKFLKNNQETAAVVEDEARRAILRAEAEILAAYLPAMADESAMEAAIAAILDTLPERGPKAMGAVMAALKAKFGAAFDARQASLRVKAALTPGGGDRAPGIDA